MNQRKHNGWTVALPVAAAIVSGTGCLAEASEVDGTSAAEVTAESAQDQVIASNAAGFLQRLSSDPELLARVMDGSATTAAWVDEAATAGYQVTADELRSAAEQLVGEPVRPEATVGVLRSMFEGDPDADHVVELASNTLSPSALPAVAKRLGSIAAYFAKDSGPSWVNSPRLFNRPELRPDLLIRSPIRR